VSATFHDLLTDLKDPAKYVRVPKKAIFDEHEDVYWTDPHTGQMVPEGTPGAKRVVQKFDKARLEKIAAHNNERTRTGDMSPITFGHTNPREPDERKQPIGRGYELNFTVDYDPVRKKHMLYADHYIRKSDYPEATTYPHTSIELWPEDDTIHPVSFLRRTPQRDVGQWIYSRVYGSDGASALGTSVWRFSRAGQPVLRYAMENTMANDMDTSVTTSPTPGLDAPMAGTDDVPPTPEEHVQFMRHCMSHPLAKKFARHYEMQDAAMPGVGEPPLAAPDATAEPIQNAASTMLSGTNSTLPQPSKRDEYGRIAGDVNRYRGGDAGSLQYQKLQQEVEEMRQREAVRVGENYVLGLTGNGLILSDKRAQKEVQRFARVFRESGDAGCKQYAAELIEEQNEVLRGDLTRPTGRVRLAASPPLQNSRHSQQNQDARVLQYIKDTGETNWQKAVEAVKNGAQVSGVATASDNVGNGVNSRGFAAGRANGSQIRG